MSIEVGKKIAALRLAKKMSQAELGRLAGVEGRTVQSIELGRRSGGWKTVTALLLALGYEVRLYQRPMK